MWIRVRIRLRIRNTASEGWEFDEMRGSLYLECPAPSDGAENAIDSQVSQIGRAASHEGGPFRLQGSHPVITLVIQRLSYVLLDKERHVIQLTSGFLLLAPMEQNCGPYSLSHS
jgi:hypothetical protein